MKLTIEAMAFGIVLLAAPAFAQTVITVAKDGSGKFATIQAAIDSVPAGNDRRCVIEIAPGVYKERLRLPANKPYVTLRGADPNATVITWKCGANELKEDGNKIGTFGTGTVYVYGHDTVVENLAVENTFGEGAQAVAMFAQGDRLIFRNCRFIGWQDTLFADAGRQYYKDCYIEGHCDFIFGNAAAYFENCTIFCKTANYITAHSRLKETDAGGYVFHNCRVTGSSKAGGVYLGRPWRPYARVIYDRCELDDIIQPEGWHNWKDPNKEKTAYYAEYKCTGPGAKSDSRVAWSRQLSDQEAAAYGREKWLAGEGNWNFLVDSPGLTDAKKAKPTVIPPTTMMPPTSMPQATKPVNK